MKCQHLQWRPDDDSDTEQEEEVGGAVEEEDVIPDTEEAAIKQSMEGTNEGPRGEEGQGPPAPPLNRSSSIEGIPKVQEDP